MKLSDLNALKGLPVHLKTKGGKTYLVGSK